MTPTLTFRSRAQWGAGPVTAGYPISHQQVRGLVIHHDVIAFDGHAADIIGAADARARALQEARPDLGPEVPYSFLLPPDRHDPDHTIIVEGRGFGRSGAHTQDWNSTRYGVCLSGDYRTDLYTPGQLRGARWLGAWLAHQESVAPTGGHGSMPHNSTDCPSQHGRELVALAQPPFTAADINAISGAPPMPDKTPPAMHVPVSGLIVDTMDDPTAGGAWVLLEDGGIITAGSARFFGTVNGKPYWTNYPHKARRLIPHKDKKGRHRYLIRDAEGNDFGVDGF